MPFYEYECSACKHHTEVLQKISDTPLRKCPSCSKQALKRLISAPVFRLKGGGWYETDFKSGNEQKRNLAGGEDAGESKTETKSEDSSASGKEAAKPADSKAAEATPAAKPAAAKPDPAASRSASKTVAKPVPKRASKPIKAKAPAKKKSARR